MDRLILTTEEQTAIDNFKSTYTQFEPDGLIVEGTNLVVDDHLKIDNSWEGVVLGGESGLVWFCIPAWGAPIMPINFVDYVTDRIGPNGEEMPIFDEQQMQARAAAKAAPQDPKHAKKDRRDHLREFLAAQTPQTAKKLRHELVKHGLMKDDDHGHDKDHDRDQRHDHDRDKDHSKR